MRMRQYPDTGDFLLKWRGDGLTVTLKLDEPRRGRAAFRTNIGHAGIRRREIIAETERGETPLARAWTDLPMEEVAPGSYRLELRLEEVGIFSGKACFFAEGSTVPEWPDGPNTHIKVESSETRANNSIYTVFPRQFGSFREIVRRLGHIMDTMGFRIIQTLPPFPVPVSYAVMGEYGCPFAATDFMSVDPAMAEFDEYATPLDQFRELIGSVHARKGLIFIDLPANHTGWASTLQTHHPDWFHRAEDGRFISPGAWGVTWADLVELDYRNEGLRAYMAEVFLFWCRNGIDGFRCDAGYMIPAETWEYIVARVREEYPDTIFMLEGLGGELKVTDRLLAESNLDWAYSEVFQTYDRGGFEWYLPGAIDRAERYGALVHFAETHDNDRLAKSGETYARLRVQLAALLSWQGAWGIANGVEWFATEKIDVHGRNDLNWGAGANMVGLIAKLNRILATEESFTGAVHLEVITRGEGNTLAVMRGEEVLLLANLDCSSAAEIDWARERFPATEAFDLLNERMLDLSGRLRLEPGEVRLLKRRNPCRPASAAPASVRLPPVAAGYHIVLPRDVNREIVVPGGRTVEVSADSSFRFRLVDPETGRTVRVFRADGCAVFDAPQYAGDGTRSNRLRMEITLYVDGRPVRKTGAFAIPPTPELAVMKTAMTGDEVRRMPLNRGILSNGAGAASQVRAGFGSLASQYDAFLAANPNPDVPSDRLNLWTRMRGWLQREGYIRELDSRVVDGFESDCAGRFVRWRFTVPCGMGREVALTATLCLTAGDNEAVFAVERPAAAEYDVGDQVRLVFRPDLEWRSFHSVTKAYAGAERLFPVSVQPEEGGFVFRPYDADFAMTVEGGEYHHEPQWTYNVAHPEEAERGQDSAGDLFSPGWISADLKIGDRVVVRGRLGRRTRGGQPPFSPPPTASPTVPLIEGISRSIDLYIVKRDGLKTVIAGYPWFLDWGRDTFIFMRGMIAAGRIDESLEILEAFAAFEESGTLPNVIYGKSAGNRDTADAQLWFIRCVGEIEETTGRRFESLRRVCRSIIDNYIKGTPNGIRMDPDSSLVWCPSHFTWMDTNYPACTPRTGYPVEIEALWISALRFIGRNELAAAAIDSVRRLFKRDGAGYHDCLSAPDGEPAGLAVPEATIRPNQLFLITLGVLDDASILDATEQLLIPGGIRSLDSGNPGYHGRYTGAEDTGRKPAYHNGTVWAWQFPLYAEAMALTGRARCAEALSLLASAVDNLNAGALCHLSENADGDAPHAQKGCAAQAWSDSELLRVWTWLSKTIEHR